MVSFDAEKQRNHPKLSLVCASLRERLSLLMDVTVSHLRKLWTVSELTVSRAPQAAFSTGRVLIREGADQGV